MRRRRFPIPMALIEQLRRTRMERGISQPVMGEMAGYGGPTICHWERGTYDPTLSNLANWAQALGYRLALLPLEPEP